MGHMGAQIRALIILKSPARSVFTATQVAIGEKLYQCAQGMILSQHSLLVIRTGS